MVANRPLPKRKKLDLILEVYQAVYEMCDTFEEEAIGADLAYLMGAIARSQICTWHEGRPLVLALREKFPPEHPVWGFIETDNEGTEP